MHIPPLQGFTGKSRRDGTLLTVCFSLRTFSLRTFSLRAVLLSVLAFFFCAGLHAQATIGGLTEPAAGAILDLNSTTKGGLALSNVTILDLELIPQGTNVFEGVTGLDVNPDLRGAIVYNTGAGTTVPAGIYIWNGYCWTKDGGEITVATPSITTNGSTGAAVTAVDGDPVTFAAVSSQADVIYQWFSNTSPSTSGGTPKDTGSSYTTPTLTAGTYYYYCTATSASCPSFNAVSSVITVTVIPDPVSLPWGNGTLSGKTCFDVVQTNDNAECGMKASRESKKHSFSDTPTETYTFTPSGAPTGLTFAYENLNSSNVIQSISQNGNQVTVTFYPGLDAAAAGLTRTDALKADLYAIFMSSGTQQKLKLTLSVSDCQCCPGLFIPGGEYSNIAKTETLPPGVENTQNTDGSAANALLSSTAANGFANRKTGYSLCYYYRDATYNGSVYPRDSWADAMAVCQTTDGIDAADAHPDWRLPNLGEYAQIGQLVSNNAESAINAGIGSQTEINKAISQGYGYFPEGTVTANGTYNLIHNNFWSSSEHVMSAFAWRWTYITSYRYVYSEHKGMASYVRCVRRF
jgi:uncharacterized protein (TIGR02145 family)